MRHEPGTGDAPDEQVRRLLAAARHDEAVPDDVAARLDAALADLPPLRPEEDVEQAPVADLAAARRRRRRAVTLLAAAAVVVVAGVGITAGGLPGGLGSGGGDASSSDAAGGSTASSPEESPQEPPGAAPSASPGPDEQLDAESGPDTEPGGRSDGLRAGTPVVRDGPSLVADLARALEGRDLSALSATRCAPPYVSGTRVRVRFDGEAADVVAAAPVDGAREVQVWTCAGDDAAPARSATVPVP